MQPLLPLLRRCFLKSATTPTTRCFLQSQPLLPSQQLSRTETRFWHHRDFACVQFRLRSAFGRPLHRAVFASVEEAAPVEEPGDFGPATPPASGESNPPPAPAPAGAPPPASLLLRPPLLPSPRRTLLPRAPLAARRLRFPRTSSSRRPRQPGRRPMRARAARGRPAGGAGWLGRVRGAGAAGGLAAAAACCVRCGRRLVLDAGVKDPGRSRRSAPAPPAAQGGPTPTSRGGRSNPSGSGGGGGRRKRRLDSAGGGARTDGRRPGAAGRLRRLRRVDLLPLLAATRTAPRRRLVAPCPALPRPAPPSDSSEASGGPPAPAGDWPGGAPDRRGAFAERAESEAAHQAPAAGVLAPGGRRPSADPAACRRSCCPRRPTIAGCRRRRREARAVGSCGGGGSGGG